MTRPRPGRKIANARIVPVVEFAGDPHGEAVAAGIANEVAIRIQGYGGTAYIGDRGDPSQSFYGYGPALQRFSGAAAAIGAGSNPNPYRDQNGAVLEAGRSDQALEDPALRIFAERLARRR